MGQGTVTSLSQLLAEELECDWKKIRTEFPGVEPVYGAPMMGTYGSLSIRTSWQPLRQAGAAAREMLVEAAAQRWNVDKSQCRAENNTVVNTATGAELTYGILAEAAAKLPAPTGITLKTAAQFKLIGTSPKRLDTPGKVNGTTGFGHRRAPCRGCCTPRSSAALCSRARSPASTPRRRWPCRASRKSSRFRTAWPWSPTIPGARWKAARRSSSNGTRASGPTCPRPVCARSSRHLAAKPGMSMRKAGDAEGAFAGAAKKVEAVYEAPYLSHAPMEPLNCHGRGASRRLRCLGVLADPDPGAADRRDGHRAARRQVPDPHPVSGRRIRTARRRGLRRRSGRDRQGDVADAGEAHLVARRRPAARHLSSRFLREVRGRTGRPGLARVVQRARRLPAVRRQLARPSKASRTCSTPSPTCRWNSRLPTPASPVSYWRSVGYSQNTFFMESVHR